MTNSAEIQITASLVVVQQEPRRSVDSPGNQEGEVEWASRMRFHPKNYSTAFLEAEAPWASEVHSVRPIHDNILREVY